VTCSIFEGHVRGGLQESPVKALNGNQLVPTNETQSAYAYVPWWIGFEGVNLDATPINNRLIYPFENTIPLVIYLVWRRDYYDSSGAIVDSSVETWDVYGNVVFTGYSGNQNSTAAGRIIRGSQILAPDKLSVSIQHDNGYSIASVNTPYTFDQAVSSCIDLLGNIELINTSKTYSGTFQFSVGSGSFSGAHFCFLSQRGENGFSALNSGNLTSGNTAVSELFVTWDLSGNPVFVVGGYKTPQSSGNNYAWAGDSTGNPSAWNGFINSSLHDNGGSFANGFDGFIVCKKMAVLTYKLQFNVLNLTILDKTAQNFTLHSAAPTLLVKPITEIFLPSSVSKYGFGEWAYNANSNLGSAGNANTGAGGNNPTTSDL